MSQLIDSESTTKWKVVAHECPVTVNDKSTRIDIILQYIDFGLAQAGTEIYSIVECKRVTVETGYWLFGNPKKHDFREPSFVALRQDYGEQHVPRYLKSSHELDRVSTYLIDNSWLAINKQGESNKYTSSPSHVEDALNQVCTGVSGWSHEIKNRMTHEPKGRAAVFIPIIITSAPLYVATYDLDAVDLNSGRYDQSKIHFGPVGSHAEEMNWVVVDYGAGRNTEPHNWHVSNAGIKTKDLVQLYKRHVYIVNSKHMIDFFRRLTFD